MIILAACVAALFFCWLMISLSTSLGEIQQTLSQIKAEIERLNRYVEKATREPLRFDE